MKVILVDKNIEDFFVDSTKLHLQLSCTNVGRSSAQSSYISEYNESCIFKLRKFISVLSLIIFCFSCHALSEIVKHTTFISLILTEASHCHFLSRDYKSYLCKKCQGRIQTKILTEAMSRYLFNYSRYNPK